MRPSTNTNIDIAELLVRFRDCVRASDVAQLSDLSRQSARQLRQLWPTLPVATRRRLVQMMAELAEENLALNFRHVFLIALDDDDQQVRECAIAGLWEEEDTLVLHRLLERLPRESEPSVRAALAQALGRFTELDVLGQLPLEDCRALRAALFSLLESSEPLEVRRRALEAAAVYSHDPRINEAIEEAYWSGEHALKVSALYAMGRSLDRRWLPLLLEELQSEHPAYRYEAATACGELGAEEAVDELISLTSDPDRAVQGAAIAALGRIGGTLATNVLRRLARSTDPVVRDAAEEALAEAVFASDPLRPTLW